MSFRKNTMILMTKICLIALLGCELFLLNSITISNPYLKSTDPTLKTMVNEYLSLAKERGLIFNKNINVGFLDIKQDRSKGYDIVGECIYGGSYREVVLDSVDWSYLSKMNHLILIFHELTHCYCTRNHDFGKGTLYKDVRKNKRTDKEKDGFYSDKCPLSVMYPDVLDDDCAHRHYGDYIQEMFNRCNPW